jgi:hypothetical protein
MMITQSPFIAERVKIEKFIAFSTGSHDGGDGKSEQKKFLVFVVRQWKLRASRRK